MDFQSVKLLLIAFFSFYIIDNGSIAIVVLGDRQHNSKQLATVITTTDHSQLTDDNSRENETVSNYNTNDTETAATFLRWKYQKLKRLIIPKTSGNQINKPSKGAGIGRRNFPEEFQHYHNNDYFQGNSIR